MEHYTALCVILPEGGELGPLCGAVLAVVVPGAAVYRVVHREAALQLLKIDAVSGKGGDSQTSLEFVVSKSNFI